MRIIKYYNKDILILENIELIFDNLNVITGENSIGKTYLLKELASEIVMSNLLLFNQNLIKELTVFENICIWKRTYNVDNEKLNLFIDLFKFDIYLSNRVKNLSSGTTRKLELILFFSKNNTPILIDEPLAFLDRESINSLFEIIKIEIKNNRLVIITDQDIFKYQSHFKEQLNEIRLSNVS